MPSLAENCAFHAKTEAFMPDWFCQISNLSRYLGAKLGGLFKLIHVKFDIVFGPFLLLFLEWL